MSSTARPLTVALTMGLAVLIPAALGLVLGAIGEQTPWTAALILGEPLILIVAVYGVGALLLSRRPAVALGLAIGTILLAAGVRQAPVPRPPTADAPPWAEAIRGCAVVPQAPQGPLRVLVWTVAPGTLPQVDNALLDGARPDLMVLVGVADEGLARILGVALGGEGMAIPADRPEAGVTLVVRGAFQICGGQTDRWVSSAASASGQSRVIATFPEVAGVGVLPFFAVHLEGPAGSWMDWPERLDAGAELLGAAVRALGVQRAVVAGDLASPRTYTHLSGLLRGAGLLPASAQPSWPTHLGPVPLPPLHALDQVWAGDAWRPTDSAAFEARGQPRAPVVVGLAAGSGVARSR